MNTSRVPRCELWMQLQYLRRSLEQCDGLSSNDSQATNYLRKCKRI